MSETTTETTLPARPHKGDTWAGVAKMLLPKVMEWLGDMDDTEAEIEQNLADLLEDESDWDGFKLAHELRGDGWDPDARLVEILDVADHYASVELRGLTEKWVAEQRADGTLPASLPVGTAVEYSPRRSQRGGPVRGEILSVDQASATYIVHSPGLGHVPYGEDGTHGTYVAWEKCKAV